MKPKLGGKNKNTEERRVAADNSLRKREDEKEENFKYKIIHRH